MDSSISPAEGRFQNGVRISRREPRGGNAPLRGRHPVVVRPPRHDHVCARGVTRHRSATRRSIVTGLTGSTGFWENVLKVSASLKWQCHLSSPCPPEIHISPLWRADPSMTSVVSLRRTYSQPLSFPAFSIAARSSALMSHRPRQPGPVCRRAVGRRDCRRHCRSCHVLRCGERGSFRIRHPPVAAPCRGKFCLHV